MPPPQRPTYPIQPQTTPSYPPPTPHRRTRSALTLPENTSTPLSTTLFAQTYQNRIIPPSRPPCRLVTPLANPPTTQSPPNHTKDGLPSVHFLCGQPGKPPQPTPDHKPPSAAYIPPDALVPVIPVETSDRPDARRTTSSVARKLSWRRLSFGRGDSRASRTGDSGRATSRTSLRGEGGREGGGGGFRLRKSRTRTDLADVAQGQGIAGFMPFLDSGDGGRGWMVRREVRRGGGGDTLYGNGGGFVVMPVMGNEVQGFQYGFHGYAYPAFQGNDRPSGGTGAAPCGPHFHCRSGCE